MLVFHICLHVAGLVAFIEISVINNLVFEIALDTDLGEKEN